MIRCMAVDDEPLALEQLKSYILQVPFLELAACCMDAFDAMKQIASQKIDVMFIDINMPDLNGMDLVKTLIDPPLIVFTTAYSQYAVDAYKVDAVDYLLKPFGLDDFSRAANKVKRQADLKSGMSDTSFNIMEQSIFVKSDYKIIKIELKNIRFIEGMSEYLRIFVEDDAKPIITLLSMRKMEERLASNFFMRVHRSYIVNLKKVQEINKLRIVMDKDHYIPIGDIYKDNFFNYINNKSIMK